MKKTVKLFLLKVFVKKTFIKYKNSLPTEAVCQNPEMDYHILADAVCWEDEGISVCHPNLENAFRFVLKYRTNLITVENFELENDDSEKINKYAFKLAKRYFKNWVGFNRNRSSYNPELSEKIARIRKVSNWKMEKLLN